MSPSNSIKSHPEHQVIALSHETGDRLTLSESWLIDNLKSSGHPEWLFLFTRNDIVVKKLRLLDDVDGYKTLQDDYTFRTEYLF